jgi:DNA-binding HxlR family transcriptional regulator
MTRYGQVCPIALAAEILAERWTPLILREIVLSGHYRFSEIRHGVGRISQSLLSERLRELERAGIVETRPNPAGRGSEYHPTVAGRELESFLDDLAIWAQHWIELRAEDLDPAYVMQGLHVNLRRDRLPARRTTIRFEFRDSERIYWLVLDREAPELCFHDPGYEVDLVVRSDVDCLTRVYLGRGLLGDALASGRLKVDGDGDLARRMPDWLGLSRYAPHARPVPISPGAPLATR